MLIPALSAGEEEHPNQGLVESKETAEAAKATELKCKFTIDDEGPVLIHEVLGVAH